MKDIKSQLVRIMNEQNFDDYKIVDNPNEPETEYIIYIGETAILQVNEKTKKVFIMFNYLLLPTSAVRIYILFNKNLKGVYLEPGEIFTYTESSLLIGIQEITDYYKNIMDQDDMVDKISITGKSKDIKKMLH